MAYSNNNSGYGKMPVWQWVLIYVVIAALVYGLIYYFVFANRGGSGGYVTPTQEPSQATVIPVSPTESPMISISPTTSLQPTSVSSARGVTISNFAFQPAQITVPVGTTVTFTNNDAMAHTVTSDAGIFDSGNLSTGQTYTYTFTKAGTCPYHCAIHRSMKGTVIVK